MFLNGFFSLDCPAYVWSLKQEIDEPQEISTLSELPQYLGLCCSDEIIRVDLKILDSRVPISLSGSEMMSDGENSMRNSSTLRSEGEMEARTSSLLWHRLALNLVMS